MGVLNLYGREMQRYPRESGLATHVGFGMACYRLGQINRVKASFCRAHKIDPENIKAMMRMAILELGSLDLDMLNPQEYPSRAKDVIKMISMANLVNHTNVMVQNQLSLFTYYLDFVHSRGCHNPNCYLYCSRGKELLSLSFLSKDVMIIACHITFSIGAPETIHFNNLSFSGVILFMSSSFL